MTVEEKMWTLARLLHEKTAKGELRWEQTAAKSTFQIPFPKYAVRISEVPGDSDAPEPDYVVSVFNEEGKPVERASDVKIANKVKDSKPFQVMQELYEMARRSALGVDSALDELISQLDAPF